MTGVSKSTARTAFDYNIADAEEALVLLAEDLQKKRVRRMRSERRQALGDALGIANAVRTSSIASKARVFVRSSLRGHGSLAT